MIINSCRYYFADKDDMLVDYINNVITIKDLKTSNNNLIKEINNNTINNIMKIFPNIKCDSYEGSIYLYDECVAVMRCVNYNFNSYYRDNVLNTTNESITSIIHDNCDDQIIRFYNKVNEINSVGKTYIINNTIYLCDHNDIANYAIMCICKNNTIKTYIDKLQIETEDFSNIIKEIYKIII